MSDKYNAMKKNKAVKGIRSGEDTILGQMVRNRLSKEKTLAQTPK